MKDPTYYLRIINCFAGKRILVIGDLLLDIYLKGESTRLCPEAPVPVVDVEERNVLPGGAANTVCNLRALGADVTFCTVVGDDEDGDAALKLIRALDVDDGDIVRSSRRKTITKTRVVSGGQVITRVDQGSTEPVARDVTAQLARHIASAFASCDAILISDYDKGVITEQLIDVLIPLQKKHKKFMAVDSKRLAFFARLSPSYAKPNYEEVLKLLSLAPTAPRKELIASHAQMLYEKTGIPLISVTLDKDGCMLIENGEVIGSFAATAIDKPSVAGAGDSFISAFMLAYMSGQNKEVSAEIAGAAAAIAIRKEATAACSYAELRRHFQIHSKWVHGRNDLKEVCDAYRRSGKRIVFTNGCFDILHSGHVTYLQRAKECGDVLIVGLNTDESIRRIKGASRPINSLSDRLQVLAGLSSVDHIIPFGSEIDDTPIPLIMVARPHVFVKGGDYTKEKLPEAKTVEMYGGEIVFIEQVPNHSTTRIINRINGYHMLEKSYSDLP